MFTQVRPKNTLKCFYAITLSLQEKTIDTVKNTFAKERQS